MTAAEWLACEKLNQMLPILRNRASERKWRLFAVACCRGLVSAVRTNVGMVEVSLAERLADQLIDLRKFRDAQAALKSWMLRQSDEMYLAAAGALNFSMAEPMGQDEADYVCQKCRALAGCYADQTSRWSVAYCNATEFEEVVQAGRLRDIFGNPFRPVPLNPAWQTTTVVGVAQAIYDEQAFDRLPILADALEETGCVSAEVLNHCRADACIPCRHPGEHVRGCWVVDLLLGKS